jgi:hypothetical protein
MTPKRNSIFNRVSLFIRNSSLNPSSLFKKHTLTNFEARPDKMGKENKNPISAGLQNLGNAAILLVRTTSMLFTAKCDKG